MSKYAPLRHNLQARPRADTELTFREIEKILGFELPASAHEHSAWWSNERETHVQARAWMDAGWQVWHVRRSEKKVYFRPCEPSRQPPPPQTTNATVEIDLGSLSVRAARLVTDYANEKGGSAAAAIGRAIEEAAAARRNRLIDRIRANAPLVQGDSTDLIREDRDAR